VSGGVVIEGVQSTEDGGIHMIAVLSRQVSACDEVVPSGQWSEKVHGLNNAE
jgi:hypothetical protein